MRMNLQDIHQKRVLILLAIKVEFVSLGVTLGLVFARVKLGVAN